MAEYRSKVNLRSVVVRRVGFICFCLSFQNVNTIVKMLGLVVLFFIRIKFPKGKSIADIIGSIYETASVRKIYKFEKNDYKLQKGHLNMFLLECKKNSLIPKILQISKQKPPQSCCLQEMSDKTTGRRNQSKAEKDPERIRNELEGTLSSLDFS